MQNENKKQFSIIEDEAFMDFLTEKFGGIDEKFDKIDVRFEKIEENLDRLDNDVKYMKNTMVTKSYLDDKLSDLKSDLILIIKRGDTKFNLLLEILLEKRRIDRKDVDKIQAIELFPIIK